MWTKSVSCYCFPTECCVGINLNQHGIWHMQVTKTNAIREILLKTEFLPVLVIKIIINMAQVCLYNKELWALYVHVSHLLPDK